MSASRPDEGRLSDPLQAARAALRSVALRAKGLREEIRVLEQQLSELVAPLPRHYGDLCHGRGHGQRPAAHRAGQSDRLRSESAFACLCGVAPVPASTGKTEWLQVTRGGPFIKPCFAGDKVEQTIDHDYRGGLARASGRIA